MIIVKAFLRRKTRKSQNFALQKAGKDHLTQEDIDAEEDRLKKLELKKYDKAIKREDKIDNGGEEDDMSVSSKSHGSV